MFGWGSDHIKRPIGVEIQEIPKDSFNFSCHRFPYEGALKAVAFTLDSVCLCYLDMNPLMASLSAGLPGCGANRSLIRTLPAMPRPTTTAPNILFKEIRETLVSSMYFEGFEINETGAPEPAHRHSALCVVQGCMLFWNKIQLKQAKAVFCEIISQE